MRIISNEVRKRLEEAGIKRISHVSKSDFTTLDFKLLNPLTDEVILEYKLIESDYNSLPYDEKRKYRKMDLVKEFDEESYSNRIAEQKKLAEIYDEKYDKMMEIVLRGKGITESQVNDVDTLMEIFSDYTDVDSDSIEELESELLSFIKKKDKKGNL